MKALKLNRAAGKLASGLACILLAACLCFLQTPIAHAVAGAETPQDAPTAVADVQAGGSSDGQDASVAIAQDGEAADEAAVEALADVAAEPADDAATAPADEPDAAPSGDGADADAQEQDVPEAVAQEQDADADDAAQDAPAKVSYTYEDDEVKVVATLERADAIPDKAELRVTPILVGSGQYNYDAYMAALNKDAGKKDAFTEQNTLLYDVAFLVEDGDGNTVEVEPQKGTVKVAFEFKRGQLTELLGAKDASDVQVTHLPLDDSAKAQTTAESTDIDAADVRVEELDGAQVSLDSADKAVMTMADFSGIAFTVLEAPAPEAKDLDAAAAKAGGRALLAKDADGADAIATIEATKVFTGPGADLAEGEFSFTVTQVANENGDDYEPEAGETAYTGTASNDADGKVAFDIPYTSDQLGGAKEKEFFYLVAEDVPDDAEMGEVVGADGEKTPVAYDNDIVYDVADHLVKVTVTDDGSDGLQAKVAYLDEQDVEDGIVFTNRAMTGEKLAFIKYFYGNNVTASDNREFSFTIMAVDPNSVDEPQNGVKPRGESDFSPVDHDGCIVDDGVRAFTHMVSVPVRDFATATTAELGIPEIRFAADGDFYYLVEENDLAKDDEYAWRDVTFDDAQYLVHVVVKDGEVEGVDYTLIYDGEAQEVDPEQDELAFYNNQAVSVGFVENEAYGYTEAEHAVSINPKAKKYVNDDTAQIEAGEFKFALYKMVDGNAQATPLITATNSEAGDVAFFDESIADELTFHEAGSYEFMIRELAGDEVGMTYDDTPIVLTVDVEQDANGDLSATETYTGEDSTVAVFRNYKEGVDVRVQKLSSDDGEGLAGCTYALWMKDADGDVMVSTADSDADGWITFEDVSLLKGKRYYFKEVSAPAGHLLDPYRSGYFTLDAASGGSYRLVSAD